MRTANVDGRLKLLVAGAVADVKAASGDCFRSSPQAADECFAELEGRAATVSQPGEALSLETALRPVPAPRQVLAAGGQDLSEPVLQRGGPASQSGLAKSFPRFPPTGPVLVTPDGLDRPVTSGWAVTSTGRKCKVEVPPR